MKVDRLNAWNVMRSVGMESVRQVCKVRSDSFPSSSWAERSGNKEPSPCLSQLVGKRGGSRE